jgi:hypothetical protein
LTYGQQAGKVPTSDFYLSWDDMKEAVVGERNLQSKEAFEDRIKEIQQQREAAQHKRLKRVLVRIWGIFVVCFWTIQMLILNETDARVVIYFFSAIFPFALLVLALGKWYPRILNTAGSAITILVLAALALVLVEYLLAVPAIKRFPDASSILDGLRFATASLLAWLAVVAVLVAAEFMRTWKQRRLCPDVVLFHHLARLAKLLKDADPAKASFSDQKRLCDHIERSAQAIEDFAYGLASRSSPDDEVLRQDFASIAYNLRALKREVALPKATYKNLADEVCRLCVITGTRFYGLLPITAIPAPPEGAPTSSAEVPPLSAEAQTSSGGLVRQAQTAQAVKSAAATVIPLAAYLLLQALALLNVTLISKQDLSTLGIVSFLLPLLYIMKFLDPNSSDNLTNAKSIISS